MILTLNAQDSLYEVVDREAERRTDLTMPPPAAREDVYAAYVDQIWQELAPFVDIEGRLSIEFVNGRATVMVR